MLDSGNSKNISDDDDDEDDEIVKNKQQKTSYWCGNGSFFKAKNKLRWKKKRLSSSSSSIINSTKTISLDESVNQGCVFCFKKLKISGSKNGSQITDPNDRNFTHEMLKVIIEKNDFYSKECNPHLGRVLVPALEIQFPVFVDLFSVKPCKVGPEKVGLLPSVLESGAVGGDQQPQV